MTEAQLEEVTEAVRKALVKQGNRCRCPNGGVYPCRDAEGRPSIDFCMHHYVEELSLPFRFSVPIEVQSQNRFKGMNPFSYKRLRDSYERIARAMKGMHGIPDADGMRTVHLVRVYRKGRRPFDYGNLVGGLKPWLDAMVRTKLLVDDSPAHCRDTYDQKRGARDELLVEIREAL